MEPSTLAEIQQLLERRRFDRARQLLGPALAAEPEDVDLLGCAALIELADGRTAEAEELAERLLASSPRDRTGREVLFQVRDEQKRYPEAEALLLDLIRDHPGDGGLLGRYSLLMLETLHVAKAEKLAAEALRLAPFDDHARIASLLCATVQGRKDTARGELERMVRESPEAQTTSYMLLTSLVDGKRFHGALRVAQELLRADPQDEELVETVIEMKAATHWTARPLWPILRYGWAAAGAAWIVVMTAAVLLSKSPYFKIVIPLAAAYLLYAVYTWTWMRVLRWWIAR